MSKANPSDWQQNFIATNLLAIGFNAWNGYLKGDRGAVICTTSSPLIDGFGESFRAYFVPRNRLAAFLNAWLAAPDTVILQGHHMNAHILEAVDNYNPETDAILLLESGDQASFLYLKNLPIAPKQCYQQICKEWSEFLPRATLLIGEKRCRDRST
jgi:hypothetical protein